MAFDESCVFCKIGAEQAPSSVVYENGQVLAFLDIRPLIMGHVLVIPKSHYVDIYDIPNEILGEVYAAVKAVAGAVRVATCADGVSLIQQNGKAAGQDIFHFHVHVVPRFEGRKLPHFSELVLVERSRLDEMARKIKQHL